MDERARMLSCCTPKKTLSAPALIAAVRAAKEPAGAITSGLFMAIVLMKKM